MDWSSNDLGDAFSLYKQKLNLYIEDEGIPEAAVKARKFCPGIGDDGLRRLHVSGLTDDEKQDIEELYKFFENHLKISVNFRIHRLHLMQYRQRKDESLDDFITRARTLALKCEFSDGELSERLIELIIDSTPYEAFRNELLSKDKGHSLKDTLEAGRRYEALTAGLRHITDLSSPTHVDALQRRSPCNNCGLRHDRRECPAFGQKCVICGKMNHWARMCQSKGQQGQQGRQRQSQLPQQRQPQNSHKPWRKKSRSMPCQIRLHQSTPTKIMSRSCMISLSVSSASMPSTSRGTRRTPYCT